MLREKKICRLFKTYCIKTWITRLDLKNNYFYIIGIMKQREGTRGKWEGTRGEREGNEREWPGTIS